MSVACGDANKLMEASGLKVDSKGRLCDCGSGELRVDNKPPEYCINFRVHHGPNESQPESERKKKRNRNRNREVTSCL